MMYRELRKLYYGTPEEYHQEYEKRIHSEEAVHLNFMIAGKTAFFLQNAEVWRLTAQIMRTDKEIFRLSSALPGVARQQYSRKCMIDEIVLTNKIEGVHSSRKEIGEALEILQRQSWEKKKHPRFISLVNKYLKLMTGEKIPLETCEDIRSIYDEIFLDEVTAENPENRPDGKLFRKEIVEVYNGAGKRIHQGIFPESKIIETLGQALDFLNDDSVEQLHRICIFHYLIEYIHPFYDGNGRLGRFILSYCISEALEPILAYRISETIQENIKLYYTAFETCNDPHNLADLTPFLLMLLRMIDTAMNDLKDTLNRRLIRWNRYADLIQSLPGAEKAKQSDLYDFLIQAALFSEGGISTADLELLCGVGYNTLKKMLNQIPAEMLCCQKKGREKYYQLDLRILDDMMLQQSRENSSI